MGLMPLAFSAAQSAVNWEKVLGRLVIPAVAKSALLYTMIQLPLTVSQMVWPQSLPLYVARARAFANSLLTQGCFDRSTACFSTENVVCRPEPVPPGGWPM